MILNSRAMQLTVTALGWMFTAIAFGLIMVIAIFYTYSRDLPDPGALAKYEPPIVTRLYTNDGRLLAEYATEHRFYLPLDAVPKRLISAFLSAEDKNFYEHSGIDFMSIVRALVVNFNNMGANRGLVGGSTITQQVVKNFLLTNEKSIERKVKEAILAFRISRNYSKDRILELYLNQIYLGYGSYGVAAAALNYFNKSLDELTVEESAFLAALPKAPANYHPINHYDRAKERRDWVINRMYEDGHITEEERDEATAMPILLRQRDAAEVAQADFFAEEVRRKLAEMYGSDVLYKGGLYVKTTVDPEFQGYADNALRYALTEYDRRHGYRGPVQKLPNFTDWKTKLTELSKTVPLFGDQELALVSTVSKQEARIMLLNDKKGSIALEEARWARPQLTTTSVGAAVSAVSDVMTRGDVVLVEPLKDAEGQPNGKFRLLQVPKVNGALVAMDPHTGRVLALSGGYSALGSEFNRATQAKRQPGSAFKPFVYLAGLEAGLTPATLILDAPISIPQGAGKPNWTPQNYSRDFLGSVTMRIGLEKSRNAMTVYLASRLGIKRIREISKRMGIYQDLPPEYSSVLGSRETTLMDLANAYAILVNGGKRITPSLIERIDDRYGKVIFRRDTRECEKCRFKKVPPTRLIKKDPPVIEDNRETVVDAATAFQMVYMLQGVVERGTAMKAKALGMPLGGKTGTTNESRDTWFVGFSPDLVVGLYVGFDQPQPLGAKETGSSVALPGFIKFMEQAKERLKIRPFNVPPGIQMRRINRWSGYPAYEGGGEVITEAFKVVTQPVYSKPAESTPNNPYAAEGQQWGTQGGYANPAEQGYDEEIQNQELDQIMFDEDSGVTMTDDFNNPDNPDNMAEPVVEGYPQDERWEPAEPIRPYDRHNRDPFANRRGTNRPTNPYSPYGNQPSNSPNHGTGGLY